MTAGQPFRLHARSVSFEFQDGIVGFGDGSVDLIGSCQSSLGCAAQSMDFIHNLLDQRSSSERAWFEENIPNVFCRM